MAQHFSLSAAALTLSPEEIWHLSDDEAHAKLVQLRWTDTNGEPVCPNCSSLKVYAFSNKRTWKCAACRKKFSVTSGTIFHSRKLRFQKILVIALHFVNGVVGAAALRLRRELKLSYKTAFVLTHKFREAMGTDVHRETNLQGEVEIDGAYFGAMPRQENVIAERKQDGRSAETQSKKQVVAVARESLGRTLPFVVPRETDAVPIFRRRIAPGTIIHADEAAWWNRLIAWYRMKRVNHSIEMVSEDGASVNQCESYNARIKRGEYGVHYRISGPYLQQYANEFAWREDHRYEPNGLLWRRVLGTSLNLPKSPAWCGYWQRGQGDAGAIPGTGLVRATLNSVPQ
jgi:transposase-like protein